MIKFNRFSFLIAIGLFLGSCATLTQVANGVLDQAGNGGGITTDEIGRGLKEALSVGIKNSSQKANALDGYLGNALIKLVFPPEAQKIESKLRNIGLGNQCDQFITALNRGAEDAAGYAVPIFVEAITQMTISDAIGILKGEKNAATQYLRKTSGVALATTFKPILEKSITKTNATKLYGDIANTYNKIPLVKPINADLAQYATDKAIDGLFVLVAEEELKIRENPAARVTDLLKKVFGS